MDCGDHSKQSAQQPYLPWPVSQNQLTSEQRSSVIQARKRLLSLPTGTLVDSVSRPLTSEDSRCVGSGGESSLVGEHLGCTGPLFLLEWTGVEVAETARVLSPVLCIYMLLLPYCAILCGAVLCTAAYCQYGVLLVNPDSAAVKIVLNAAALPCLSATASSCAAQPQDPVHHDVQTAAPVTC